MTLSYISCTFQVPYTFIEVGGLSCDTFYQFAVTTVTVNGPLGASEATDWSKTLTGWLSNFIHLFVIFSNNAFSMTALNFVFLTLYLICQFWALRIQQQIKISCQKY